MFATWFKVAPEAPAIVSELQAESRKKWGVGVWKGCRGRRQKELYLLAESATPPTPRAFLETSPTTSVYTH